MHVTSVALTLLAMVTALQLAGVSAHGRLISPPSRSSMWRFGFSTPVNYNDNELFCGGINVQHNEINRGRCGECGDEWSIPRPRPNEEGGRYGNSIISHTYSQGQLVQLEVELTARHLGYFEFRLCPKKSAEELVTQECLDGNLLKLEDGSTRFPITDNEVANYYPKVQLPSDIVCDNCVIQWTYTSGNNWGICQDGSGALGCGPQETFVNCADVAIRPAMPKK